MTSSGRFSDLAAATASAAGPSAPSPERHVNRAIFDARLCVPPVPAAGAPGMLAWKKHWRPELWVIVHRGDLALEAGLIDNLGKPLRSSHGVVSVPVPRVDMRDELSDRERMEREAAAEAERAWLKAQQSKRAHLQGLWELNQMRNEDDRSARSETLWATEQHKRELFAAGGVATRHQLDTGDPSWRRRARKLVGFCQWHGITLRSLYDAACVVREREDDAIDREREREARFQIMWQGGDLAHRDNDPATQRKRRAQLLRGARAVDLKQLCATLGIDKPDARDAALFNAFDEGHLGLLDMLQFIVALSSVVRGTHRDKARLVFAIVDRDGNGVLDFDEVLQFYQAQWHTGGNDYLMTKKVKHLFAQCDADGNGTVDFNEFLEYTEQNPDAWMPEYLRHAAESKVKAARDEEKASLRNLAGGLPNITKKRGAGSRSRRAARKEKGARTRTRSRPKSFWDLGVKKAADLRSAQANQDLVSLPPYLEMIRDQTIKGWSIDFDYSPSGFPLVQMKKGKGKAKAGRQGGKPVS